ncbi:MAG: hypothetical protein JW726_05625 [Anaerolineales bacterium]|nr:hypothetical protein [Anaerolineales bacterium]
MNILAAQYLESVPSGLTPEQARSCLRHAFDILPLTHILLGWDVPPAIESVIADETARHSAKLYQWHPLLTGDQESPPDWHTRNLHGEPIPGYNHLPEFTFLCPNHPAVVDFITARIEKVVQRRIYHGLFLDRIRFPSPTASPEDHLGCFCKHCCRAAREAGFDLEEVRIQINGMLPEKQGRIALLQNLFTRLPEADSSVQAFLRFRADSITQRVAATSLLLNAAGIEVGLDCFSPSLAWMVGQDLRALGEIGLWTKIMTYPRTFGPAGLPFELLGLLDWLTKWNTGDELTTLRECSGLDLPMSRQSITALGLPSTTIHQEIELGKRMGVEPLLAGLALVELPGINTVKTNDLNAWKNADGLVLSWDLWHISPKTLSRLKSLDLRQRNLHLVQVTQAGFYLNALIWIALGIASIVQLSNSSSISAIVVAVLILVYVAVLLGLGWLLGKQRRQIWFLALGVIAVSIVLTITDQFGLLDLLVLLLNGGLFGLLVASRKLYH